MLSYSGWFVIFLFLKYFPVVTVNKRIFFIHFVSIWRTVGQTRGGGNSSFDGIDGVASEITQHVPAVIVVLRKIFKKLQAGPETRQFRKFSTIRKREGREEAEKRTSFVDRKWRSELKTFLLSFFFFFCCYYHYYYFFFLLFLFLFFLFHADIFFSFFLTLSRPAFSTSPSLGMELLFSRNFQVFSVEPPSERPSYDRFIIPPRLIRCCCSPSFSRSSIIVFENDDKMIKDKI